MGRDFYAILGCARSADEAELKKCYKKQAMKYHPDRHSSKGDAEKRAAEEKFKEAAEAFEVLSDKQKRHIYDTYGEEGLKNSPGAGAPGGGGMPTGGMPAGFSFGGMPGGGGATFSFSTSGGPGGGGGGMSSAQAEELFASLFGSGGGLGGGLGRGGDDPFASLMGGMGGGIGGGMGGMGGLSGMMGGNRKAKGGGCCGGGSSGGGGVQGGGCCGSKGRAAARVDQLPRGSIVRLVDLSDPKHNGHVGRVEAFDEAKGRYVVALEGGGGCCGGAPASLAVKPENVRQIIAEATVTGTSQGEINGRTASAATYCRASKRYRCEGLKHDGTVLSLRPENVILPENCRVMIDGVNSRKELNGQRGKVVGVQDDRYVVQLKNEAVSLKFGAVAAC